MTQRKSTRDDELLRRQLAWLRITDCTCEYKWKSFGTLYRVSMGDGWVRMTTDPKCSHHGANST